MGCRADPLVSPPPLATGAPASAGAAGLAFSPMREEDLEAVLDIERRSFAEPWSRGMFLHELKIPFSKTTVARACNPAADVTAASGPAPIMGYICRWLVGDELQILNLAVHPEARHRGAGRALITLALREAEAVGARVITLEVQRQNAAALALYHELGFRECGVRRHYYGRGADAVLMQRLMHPAAPVDVDNLEGAG